MNSFIKIRSILLSLIFIVAALTGSAWANTAANTLIINQAQLSYNDGAGIKTASATVNVTVALVPTPTNIAKGPDQTATYAGPATKLTNSFTVTATANGPDTYLITSAIMASANSSGATVTPQVASVYLGATVSVTGSSTTVIVVPSDGLNDGKVNGIHAGSVVVVGSDNRTVQSVADNATGSSTITLTSPLSAAPGAGVLVAEQTTVAVDVTAGTISTPGSSITVSKTLTLTSATNNAASVTSAAITDTFTSGSVTLVKYVRNVTAPSGSGSPYTYNSSSYYQAGVNAKPGDTLEYILVSTNSGSGPVTSSAVTDQLPTAYVTLIPNAYGSGKEVTYVSDTGTPAAFSAASDADQATYVTSSGTLTVFVGSSATNSTGGSIPGGNKSVLLLYQVKVN